MTVPIHPEILISIGMAVLIRTMMDTAMRLRISPLVPPSHLTAQTGTRSTQPNGATQTKTTTVTI